MYQSYRQRPKSLEEAMVQALTDRPGDENLANDPDEDAYPGAVTAAMKPPAAPSGYVLTPPKGVAWDPALEKAAREWFFNAGLPQSVVTGIMQQYCRRACEGTSASQPAEDDRALAGLRSEWGEDWDRNIGLARDVVKSSKGGQQLLDILDNTGLGNDAWLIRTLAAVGQGSTARSLGF
jgi:hypothetical protein